MKTVQSAKTVYTKGVTTSYAEATRPETAGTLVDPTTIPNLLDMCFSALDGLDNEISTLRDRLNPILSEKDQAVPMQTIGEPSADCKIGAQIANLYVRISQMDRRLTSIRQDVKL